MFEFSLNFRVYLECLCGDTDLVPKAMRMRFYSKRGSVLGDRRDLVEHIGEAMEVLARKACRIALREGAPVEFGVTRHARAFERNCAGLGCARHPLQPFRRWLHRRRHIRCQQILVRAALVPARPHMLRRSPRL